MQCYAYLGFIFKTLIGLYMFYILHSFHMHFVNKVLLVNTVLHVWVKKILVLLQIMMHNLKSNNYTRHQTNLKD